MDHPQLAAAATAAVADSSHAHAVFIELTFALNTVFAIYEDLRKQVSSLVNNFVKNVRARIATYESSDEEGEVHAEARATISEHMETQAQLHDARQEKCFPPICFAAILSAVAALAILFFDHIHTCGKWCGLLILPLPLYMVCLYANYGWFRLKVTAKLSAYEGFRKNFSKKPKLPDISSLTSLPIPPTRPSWLKNLMFVILVIVLGALVAVAGWAIHRDGFGGVFHP